jgi:hypothetical protein
MPHLRRWPWFVAILALVATGSTAAAVRADRARHHVRWDPRVAPYAAFVERTRGLRYDHPVPTAFLSDTAFRAEVTSNGTPTAAGADELRHREGLFRALGLAGPGLDLRKATNTLNGEEIIGLYDPDKDRIFVRGSTITPAMRPTIVHELTHALQAQHFGLTRTGKTSGEDTAFTALVEADAVRIEDAYVASLPTAEQQAILASDAQQAASADLGSVPPILTELFSLPYVLGPPFVDALMAAGGQHRVDLAFRHPPSTEKHIVDPDAFLRNERPVHVATPPLAAGEKRVGEPDDFGMVSLLLVLGERVPFAQAWTAVEGWEGDASISYRAGGKDCIRIRAAFDTPADTGHFLDAARAWVAGHPDASAHPAGHDVELASCDPGASAAAADPARPRTFELLQLRIELVASLKKSGLDPRQAGCVSDALFREHDPAALLALAAVKDSGDPKLLALQRDVATSTARCRAGG